MRDEAILEMMSALCSGANPWSFRLPFRARFDEKKVSNKYYLNNMRQIQTYHFLQQCL